MRNTLLPTDNWVVEVVLTSTKKRFRSSRTASSHFLTFLLKRGPDGGPYKEHLRQFLLYVNFY
jgi:hypothetical protein